MDKLLTLEDVVKGVRPIVEADPDFTYPMQEDEDPRCKCVEMDTTEEENYDGYYHDPSDCPWHFNDDNTCLYIKSGTTQQPACVVGSYFVNVLGFQDLVNYEGKSPQRVLDGHGYEVEPNAQRFLNAIQTNQDHGQPWGEAMAGALSDAGYKNE